MPIWHNQCEIGLGLPQPGRIEWRNSCKSVTEESVG